MSYCLKIYKQNKEKQMIYSEFKLAKKRFIKAYNKYETEKNKIVDTVKIESAKIKKKLDEIEKELVIYKKIIDECKKNLIDYLIDTSYLVICQKINLLENKKKLLERQKYRGCNKYFKVRKEFYIEQKIYSNAMFKIIKFCKK